MKSRIIQVIGVAAALLAPAAGLVALTPGTSGATTTANYKVTSSFTFTDPSHPISVACPPFYGTRVKTGTTWKFPKYTVGVWPFCTFHGTISPYSITDILLLLTADGIHLINSTGTIASTKLNFGFVFSTKPTTMCIVFLGAMNVSKSGTTTRITVATTSATSTASARVTGSGSGCTALAHQLHTTTTSKFKATFTLVKQSTIHVRATFTFHTAAGTNTLFCSSAAHPTTWPAHKLVTGTMVQIKSTSSTQQVSCEVTPTRPTHGGIPKTSTVKLLVMGPTGWLLYTLATGTGTIKAGTLVIKITFTPTKSAPTKQSCTVSFGSAIPVLLTTANTTATITPPVHMSGATVGGTGSDCTALHELLSLSTATFTGTISGL